MASMKQYEGSYADMNFQTITISIFLNKRANGNSFIGSIRLDGVSYDVKKNQEKILIFDHLEIKSKSIESNSMLSMVFIHR